MLTSLTMKVPMSQSSKLCYLLLNLYFCATAWPHGGENCPSSNWSIMCRPCCEYQLIQCRCPSKGSRVGYTVPCCRNALDQCDPCIIHPGCSLFENCKTCHNGTWKANDNFFVNGKYCTECRQGWSGGDCKTCGGVIKRAQGHVALESYPTNALCEWTVQVEKGSTIELRFSLLSLESDHSCRYDYVEVRDGDDLSSPVIGRFCGDQLPPLIKSSGSLLHILFTSDGYNNFDGFVFTFQESAGRPKSRVRCTPSPKLLNGYQRPALDTAGDVEMIEFSCRNSYILSGNHRSTCLSNGSWSSSPPKCVKACREPKVSELVRQTVVNPHLNSRFNMHDLLSAGFIPFKLDRQSNADGDYRTVKELPRGFHPVYTRIEYRCASPLYRPTGSSQRTCLKTGRWSGSHVSCSPVCGKFDFLGANNLSDTQWPWHAAVYIRSPPAHSASTHRSNGKAVSDQPGFSEESTFWYLACSGALLTQHSVLVTAQCVVDTNKQQPLHPAHVKVAIGMRYQTQMDQLKSLHYLRVTDIFVHQKFYSAPEFNVAVLKLKDKAKISERVLPVCLPKMRGGEVTAQEAHTSRWILTHNYVPLSQTKLVELSDVAYCEREFAQGGAHNITLSDNTLCVIRRPASPQSSCSGVIPGLTTVFSSRSDILSGHKDAHKVSNSKWQLLGLENFEESNCPRQIYTVQTRVAHFQDWIEQNIK
ncbi:inactive serine protease PAMR1-like [Channa argus]|uniref:inactive serine protease PAMR1-like n=1 Tax=Channa argus TaxID=215402 RepID=UPI0029469B7C|nr:hypothetical protein Q8A73_002108 [Channa argus]